MKKLFSVLFSFILIAAVYAERPLVNEIQALAAPGGKINVFWTLPENPEPEIQALVIYRDTKVISSMDQILLMDPIATVAPNVAGYTDSVSDFTDYYYAVIAFTDRLYNLVLLSVNSTVNGTHLEVQKGSVLPEKKQYEKLYPDGMSREMPLPYIDFVDGVNREEISTLSEEAVNSARELARPTKKNKETLPPYYFEEDLISPDGGEDYLLFEILKNYFVKKNYAQSITELERLTGTNISNSTRARAIFYLGESYYMLGSYEEAIKIFVRVESAFPSLTTQWLDSSLDLIK